MTRHDSAPELPMLEPQEEERLGALLRHAFAPAAIDGARHEQLLLAALEDPFAAPSAEELVQSERLRRALSGEGDHADLNLARALANAYAPNIAQPKVEAPLTQASPRASRPSVASAAPEQRATVFYLRFAGIATALAAAAVLLLAVQSRTHHPATPELPALALVQSRSTAALFQADTVERPTTRIDRIASVRERDLRDNRYALWGVR